MAKKSFKEINPALQFISADSTDNTDDTHTTDNTVYMYNTDNTQSERKTKRLNLLLQPSVMQRVTKIAHMQRRSVNDLIGSVLSDYVSAHAELITGYDKVFGDER